jgi:hypothetical protein
MIGRTGTSKQLPAVLRFGWRRRRRGQAGRVGAGAGEYAGGPKASGARDACKRDRISESVGILVARTTKRHVWGGVQQRVVH